MAKKPIKITEVVLRDAHQSLLATRMTMDEMRPILPEMDKIPYFSVECWGGATFDSCIRLLDEDPWERLPRSCAFLEDKLKKLVAAKVSRGKVELSLSIQTVTAADTVVTVNWQLAEGYRAALNAMAERMDLKNDVSVGMLSRFPDVLTQTAAPTNEDELWEDVKSVAEQAVDAFIAMRAVEGEKMKADVAGRLTTIETLVGQIEENSAGRVQAYSDKLYARLQELLGDRSIDEGRLVTEAAIFADKTAIDEETVRLHSHVAQYREILELDEPIGRKLDFLTQELNRESNTIGSKCQDVSITRLVVELKSEIEKIREQIQNIE